ncbi:MFS transporter [Actinomadura scrupuli]|uniref:MFS transporter n=1 Tax=Actinomadura scrupuli TaxID=559629 RepID=UPI003D9564C8
MFGAALLGRLSYGISPVSLILALIGATGSYAVAGGVMALFALTICVFAPVRAWLIDRYGPARVLPPMAVAYALVLASLAAATWRPGAPGPLLGGLAMAAGVSAPPLGPVMRTLWSELLSDPALLRRGYSLDTVAEDLLYVAGPLLAGLVAGFAAPSAGVALSAGLVLAGTLTLVSSPSVRGLSRPRDTTAYGPPKRSRIGVEVAQPVAAALGVGLFEGSVELFMVAFTEQHHQASAVAWCVASLSAGSVVGGLIYGALPWRESGRLRLPLLVAVPAVGLALAGLSPNVHVLAVVAGATGLFISPALATAYLIADQSAARRARTQAGAWVNTAVNGGFSGGTAAAGLLLGRLSLAACFAIAAVPILLAAATTLVLHICTSTTTAGQESAGDDIAGCIETETHASGLREPDQRLSGRS